MIMFLEVEMLLHHLSLSFQVLVKTLQRQPFAIQLHGYYAPVSFIAESKCRFPSKYNMDSEKKEKVLRVSTLLSQLATWKPSM